MSTSRTASVADALKIVEINAQRQRFVAILEIGVKRDLSMADLVKELPAEENQFVARILGMIPASALLTWLRGSGASCLDRAFGLPAKPSRARRNQSPSQPKLPGIDSRIKPETVEFDRSVVSLISAHPEGAKSGELRRQLNCSRGKLRLAVERSKKRGYISQDGELNGARYFATPSGKSFIKEPST
jgi:hypothetical protein